MLLFYTTQEVYTKLGIVSCPMKNSKSFIRAFLLGNKALLIVIVLGVLLSCVTPVFLTSRNLLNVLRQVCSSTILALGFTLVLGTGNIDLSVGSQIGIIGIIMVKLMKAAVPVPLAILIGASFGALVGFINAGIILTFKLPAFIVTLAMQQILRGSGYLISGMLPQTGVPDSFVFLGQGYFMGIPVPVYIMIAMVVIIWLLVNRFKYGRYMLALGGNAEAARVSGINTRKVLFQTYIYMGLCATVASVVLTARAASAQPTSGLNMEMDAIAAVVVGGTSMSGGVVNVPGAFFGSLIVGMVNNGLNLIGVDSNWQIISKGLLILFAVLLDSISTIAYSRMNRSKALKNVGTK